jgi:dipeptidyl aminopeptidase/acylaminoacyl peptidase
MNQFLANQGYMVCQSTIAVASAMVWNFAALNYGATRQWVNDVLGTGLYMRSRPEVDPQRIGLWGGSYGGYLTAMGSPVPQTFRGRRRHARVHDWNIVIRFVPAYDPRPGDAARRIESSPLSSVKTWRSPVLLIHGDDDRNVPFSETVHLVEALRDQEWSLSS